MFENTIDILDGIDSGKYFIRGVLTKKDLPCLQCGSGRHKLCKAQPNIDKTMVDHKSHEILKLDQEFELLYGKRDYRMQSLIKMLKDSDSLEGKQLIQEYFKGRNKGTSTAKQGISSIIQEVKASSKLSHSQDPSIQSMEEKKVMTLDQQQQTNIAEYNYIQFNQSQQQNQKQKQSQIDQLQV